MLNYFKLPGVPGSPPPSLPGTLPAAVPPGLSSAPSAEGPVLRGGPPSPDVLSAISPAPVPVPLLPPGVAEDAAPQYQAVTQEDGSILLHIKNADGSLGPAVKIVPPIKPRGTDA